MTAVATAPSSRHAANGTEPEADEDLVGRCDGCGQHRPIVAGILLLETEDLEPDDYGFCTQACLVLFVQRRWMRGASS